MVSIKINIFQTKKSFESNYWKGILNLIHKDLNLKSLPLKNLPLPSLLNIYWHFLWKKEENIGKEFLNPSNMHMNGLRKIWEYTQIVASINYILKNNLKGKKILSLGARVEPCLFILAKLGAEVIASDIYDSPNFWSTKLVKILKEKPEIFCDYLNFKPNIKFINLNLRNKKEINKLGKYDVIYSVSTLEHIFSSFIKKKQLFKNIIKHLKDDGVFSFTTEVVIKYSKIRNYRKYIHLLITNLKNIFSTQKLLKYFFNILLKSISVQELKNLIYKIKYLYRFNRRYDFFTIEELKKLIKTLYKHNVYLVEKVDWKSCLEFPKKPPNFKDQYYSSISLTFSKNSKFSHTFNT